jgi:sulfatase modifying factor 1
MRRALQAGLLLSALLMQGAGGDVAPVDRDRAGMVLVPAGTYVPLFRSTEPEPVPAFWLDERPVTNREFLEFVRSHPEWRRSRVSRALADTSYLAHWEGDLDPGALAPAEAPVTGVSWFAARAYAKAQGKRLPTQAEWERAASAGPERDGQADDPEFLRRLLRWYAQPVRLPLPEVRSTEANLHGVWDLHNLVWEWVSDFNTALVTGESRADSALERNLFCGSGAVGASSFRDYAAFMRYAFRSSLQADFTVRNLGFRCARDGEGP